MDFKQKYFTIWQDVWGLHKKYWIIPVDKSETWKQFIVETEMLRNKYAESPEEQFVEKLILAVVNEVENLSKQHQQ